MDKKHVFISLVIPAYNERERIVPTVEKSVRYLAGQGRNFEIIVVDDGSTDGTPETVDRLSREHSTLRLISASKNRGKGYAVKKGLIASSGEICVFMDADGSVQADEITKNMHYLESSGYDIFIGSRVCRGPDQRLKIAFSRKCIGTIYNLLVRILLFNDFKDTQCGFKMFKREVIIPLFSKAFIDGFSFDVEILYLALGMGYKVKEGPVSWSHVKGSKIDLVRDPMRMISELFEVRRRHSVIENPFSGREGPVA